VIFRASSGAHGQFLRFAATSLIMRAVEYAFFFVLLRHFGVNYLVSITVAMVFSSCIKFVLYRTFVFTKYSYPE
jgi:putative flippase GtrA